VLDNYEFLRTLDPINVEYNPHALEMIEELISGVSSVVDIIRNTPFKEHYRNRDLIDRGVILTDYKLFRWGIRFSSGLTGEVLFNVEEVLQTEKLDRVVCVFGADDFARIKREAIVSKNKIIPY